MKKTSFIAMLFAAFAMSATLTACSDDEDGEGVENTGNGGTEGGGSGMSADNQKQQLEAAANELMGKVKAADFKAVTDLFSYVERTSGDESAIEDWFEACADACEQPGSTSAYVKNLYKASNFYGSFEMTDGYWKQTGTGSNLQFRFRDESNRECVLLLTHSGKETTIHHDELDNDDWDYYYQNGQYYSTHTRYENKFVIPENINITLTQDGTQLATLSVNTSLTIADASGEVQLDRDRMNVTTTLTVSGYSFAVSNAAFNAGKSAEATMRLMKGNETLVTAAMQADGNVTDDEATVKKASVNIDVLGRVQLKGTISDLSRFNDLLDDAYDASYDETQYKSYISKANELLDLKVYFDGSSASSSYIKLYPMMHDRYYYEDWYYEPVIYFSDGTGYSTMGDYFDEDYFENVIDKFEKLIDDFASLAD